jgi:hypothetical protein
METRKRYKVGERKVELVENWMGHCEVLDGGDVIGFLEYAAIERRWYAKDHNGWMRGFAEQLVALAELVRHDDAVAL